MSFLRRVTGLALKGSVRSSDFREEKKRAATPLHQEDPVEMVWASGLDGPWMLPFGGVLEMSIWEETYTQT